MSTAIEVDFDGMKHAVEDLRRYAREMQQELDDLTRHLDVLALQWRGEAHDAYRQAQVEWNQQMGVTTESLNAAADELAAAIDAYQEAEDTVVRECG